MLSNDFMQYAFEAGTAIAVLGGLVGYFVVLRRQTFAGEGLSHVAFVAALGAVLLGFNLLLGMFVITLATALSMGAFADQARSYDVAVGTVLAWVLGIGALFLSIYTAGGSLFGLGAGAAGSTTQVGVNVLFGSILGLQPQEVKEAVAFAAAAIVAILLIARPLLFATLDPTVAVVRGVPVRMLGIVFIGLVAITVAEALQLVGWLLVLAIIVLPGATAQRWTARPFTALILSAALAVALTWAGLTLGYFEPYPVTFFITTLAFFVYVGTMFFQYVQSRLHGLTPRSLVQTLSIRRKPNSIS
jgi:zinc/manganese transport system permease protein